MAQGVGIGKYETREVGDNLNLSGRIYAIRNFKNVVFFDVEGPLFPKLQVCVKKSDFPQWQDAIGNGNLVKVSGNIGLSGVGEKTLFANYIQLEARCEKPILKGQISTRNNRIAELLQNPEKARFLLECSAIKTKIRNYFQTQAGFAEMETGILQPRFHAGLAKPFTTRSNALDQTLFLRLTSEVRLRAMLAIGIDRVMEIGPSFRNEGISNIYNPEFTLFEAYAARMPHEELMRLFENAVQYGLFEIGDARFPRDFSESIQTPWERVDFYDALSSCTGESITRDTDKSTLISIFNKCGGREFDAGAPIVTLILKFFNHCLAPKIKNPTFITGMPSGACSPLVARNKEFPNTAECAWLIINGVVVGDFYDDENRRDVLDKRLDEQARQLRKTVDRELVELIDYGMPASSGMGVGLNRLYLALRPEGIDNDIKSTIPFP